MTKLGPYQLNSIITGDARELSKAIPDNSVDLIFTDPVYDRVEDYGWLAQTAARVLKDDRACLVWLGQTQMPSVIEIMSKCLNYAWCLILQRVGGGNWGRTGTKKYEPCLWFEKGNSKPIRPRMWDFFQSCQWPKNHPLQWDKPIDCTTWWLESFTQPGAIVFDPFTGGGTVPAVCKMLGRNYLAFEIDEITAQKARERVLLTQPPLLLPEPKQLELA